MTDPKKNNHDIINDEHDYNDEARFIEKYNVDDATAAASNTINIDDTILTSIIKCSQNKKTKTTAKINLLATPDTYNLTAFDQCNGIWPLDHPLPLADWSPNIKETLQFDNVWQYEDLNALIEAKLHHMLEETYYDTVHNFIDFYKSFKKTRRCDLRSFFQFYDIPINRRHHMCVSLAMEIIVRITEIFPELTDHLYIVSCEEAVESPQFYIESVLEAGLESADACVEKEHALVAMKISISGRQGIMILDPGYHVARAVTIMKDQCYPHTGKNFFFNFLSRFFFSIFI